MSAAGILPSMVAALACGAVGGLYLAAGIAKLRDPDHFLGTMAAYRLLPDGLLAPAAWMLAGLETMLGVMMLAGVAVRWAGVAAALLFGVFAAAMAINVLRGRVNLSCGCLPGLAGARLSWLSVVRTLALAPLALVPVMVRLPGSWLLRGQSLVAGACLLALALSLSNLLSSDGAGEERSA
ncbi:MauE/DoxX family redox-associated membrane protein [Gluconacetobacter tumulisoli]|uniref:Methylamine utilization protein MauE n=1 Tax=Gluconacetobacter tumulisoli TaxID=1286189 RepID=A0A7W4K713_9PROT|nr:MauE/DoxX family redox-associated membrane protein [Gluconacetobacter tumulisoli]MBB2201483.1 DoxX family membrane protein [Gluconacetobacter tumulisoli]